MQQPDNARTLQQAESLNQLFDEKAFSWTLAMEDLETVLPAGVQVTTLEPTVKDGQITVHLRVSRSARSRRRSWCRISNTPATSSCRASWAKPPSPKAAPISAPNR